LAIYAVSYPVDLVLFFKAADFVEAIKLYKVRLEFSENLAG
jgi:hypothetical protein